MSTHSSEAVKYLIQYALRILGRRSYSTDMMRRKVEARIKLKSRVSGFARDTSVDTVRAQEMSEVMEYLTSHQLLDDEAYAKNFIESMRQRQKSDRWISQKLMQKGISRDVITTLLTPADAIPLIHHHLQHKLSFHPNLLQDKKTKDKLVRWLLGKGFGYGDIVKAIEQIKNG